MRLEAAAVTIRGFLLADVFADLLQLEAHSGHGVPTGPKVLAREIPFLAAQAGHRYSALPFQKPDHRNDRIPSARHFDEGQADIMPVLNIHIEGREIQA